MESDSRKVNRPKSRQSLAHLPSVSSSIGKDNLTTDIAALQRGQNATSLTSKKKSRGKSLGPGGLEALQETSGNATKNVASFQIKSILKPTIPLTPPKVIPSFHELRNRSTTKPKSPSKGLPEDLLIDFSTPGPSRVNGGSLSITDAQNALDPFSPITRDGPLDDGANGVNAPSEEQQREAETKRQAEKQAILDRRAARRKSLANRRVSFAPEATLHTWSVMELPEDSTTSSASNSTRRQSSMTAAQSPNRTIQSPAHPSQHEDRPSTPVEQIEESIPRESPAHQRDLHQKKRRRRSSAIQDGQLDMSMEEVLSSSPVDDVTTDSSPIRIDDGADSGDGSDMDADTAMSLDESTSHTMTSQASGSSTQSSLDERLRNAANVAGTRGIEYDENGDDLSMELATATVTHAFQPWQMAQNAPDPRSLEDQENVNPFSHTFKAKHVHSEVESSEEDDGETQDMSMDVTAAVGGIVANGQSSGKGRRKSVVNRRRSSVARRRSSGGDSIDEDMSMDLTTVGGGILPNGQDEAEQAISDEDLTMEFTNVLGGVLNQQNRRSSVQSEQMDENETMDMTTAVGGILPPIEEQTEPQTDAEDGGTMAMEMTKAVGVILPAHLMVRDKIQAKQLMQEETDAGQLSISPRETTTVSGGVQPVLSIASESGSPDFCLKPRLSGRARQSMPGLSTTPKMSPKRATPVRSITKPSQATPTKQVTPLPVRAETPNKTPLSSSVIHRGASPKKLFRDEIKARASPASNSKVNPAKSPGLFARDQHTGQHTPMVVLKATRPVEQIRRRSSGVGIDREGFGSPKVSDLLDRRSSIGEAAAEFILGENSRSRTRFEDPKLVEQQVDAERAEEERRESGRFIMEQEANEQQDENATLQLKEMIEAMSPKKPQSNKLKGRKSLAVGAAKGLLGKRPAELDLDDEDGETTPKRLKALSRESSPVKKVHLPKPPTKEETTGRLTRAEQKRLETAFNGGTVTPALGSPPTRKTTAESPQVVGRFKDVPLDVDEHRPESFEEKLDNVIDAIDASTVRLQSRDHAEEKISLQSFLNMTNIHFIELSTTKRRHTMAQSMPARSSQEGTNTFSTDSVFTTATTTLPLIELYQHATRELKSYISAGRKIIRSIEAETLAEQPALFREYVDARADVKVVMDNQFRNGKINARLQSREGWYTWRAQLVDGLRSGLEGIKNGMLRDSTVLDQQLDLLHGVVPQLIAQRDSLEMELVSLRQSIEELDSIDNEVLEESRSQLQNADEEYSKKSDFLQSLQQQLEDKEEALTSAAELKTEMQEQITEADRVRNEYRGWPVADVMALKRNAELLEKQSGWRLLRAEEDTEESGEFGTALTMMFKNELRLFFYPSTFHIDDTGTGRRRSGRKSRSVSGPTAPISLTFAPAEDNECGQVQDLSTEKRFFLQLIQSQLHAFAIMPKGSISPRTILSIVAKGWDMANQVAEEIRLLSMTGIVTTSILGDEKLGVTVMLMSIDKSRLNVRFEISITLLNDGDIVTATSVSAEGMYGTLANLLSGSKGRKVQQALNKEVDNIERGNGSWIGTIHAFEEWITHQLTPKPDNETKIVSAASPAATQIPDPPKSIKRSPLAQKKTSVIQKKTLPVPKHRLEKPAAMVTAQQIGKENIPLTSTLTSKILQHEVMDVTVSKGVELDMDMDMPRPAITPAMQEAMMHTPIKRVGALRRSPI